MKKYLVKECMYCKNVLKIIMEDREIVNTEGCRQYLKWPYRSVSGSMIFTGTTYSNKLVVCQGKRIKHGVDAICGRESRVVNFKEIS